MQPSLLRSRAIVNRGEVECVVDDHSFKQHVKIVIGVALRPAGEKRIIRVATISAEEVVMHDGREAGLAGRGKPPQKPRGGILAGIVVLLWALTSAMWAEI